MESTTNSTQSPSITIDCINMQIIYKGYFGRVISRKEYFDTLEAEVKDLTDKAKRLCQQAEHYLKSRNN